VQGGTSDANSTNAILVSKKSGIRRPEDLAGKTVAVNTLSETAPTSRT
jgi:ABC-type nitrate/sulfonate/bicarbonate transport system substrate-binding protein